MKKRLLSSRFFLLVLSNWAWPSPQPSPATTNYNFPKRLRAGEGDVEITFCIFPNFRERKSENISAEKNSENEFNVPLSRPQAFGKIIIGGCGRGLG